MAISRDLPPLVHGRAIGWQNYVAIQNQPASRLMTDYSWRAGSQADETAIVLKNCVGNACLRSEEHTSELQSLMRNSSAAFCLKKKYNNAMQPTRCYDRPR